MPLIKQPPCLLVRGLHGFVGVTASRCDGRRINVSSSRVDIGRVVSSIEKKTIAGNEPTPNSIETTKNSGGIRRTEVTSDGASGSWPCNVKAS